MQSIQFKRTNVSGKKPTPEQLQVGEVAINLKDHVIFTKDRDHEVVQISVSPETHAALESKWICPYISRHLLSLNPLQARCRRYSRGER